MSPKQASSAQQAGLRKKEGDRQRGKNRELVASEQRVKPVRVTVDLDPTDYDALRDWAYQARMSHSDVLRSLVHLLVADKSVGQQIRTSVSP